MRRDLLRKTGGFYALLIGAACVFGPTEAIAQGIDLAEPVARCDTVVRKMAPETIFIPEGHEISRKYTEAAILPVKRRTSCSTDVQNSFGATDIVNHGAFMSGTIGGGSTGGGDGDVTRAALNGDRLFLSTQGSGGVPMRFWFSGDITHWEGSNNSFDGTRGDIATGFEWDLGSTGAIGVVFGYSETDFNNTGGLAGSFDADGRSIGAYWNGTFANGVIADVLLAHTGSNYAVSSAGVTGTFDANRLTFAAGIRRNYQVGGGTLQPELRFIYASEKQDAYTDSAAVLNAARTIEAGRITLGSRFIFDERSVSNGTYQPWLRAAVEYEFTNQPTATTTTLPDFDDITSLRLGGGFDYDMGNALLSGTLDIGGIGSGTYTSYGVGLKLTIPF